MMLQCNTCGEREATIDQECHYWTGEYRVYCASCFDAEYVGDPPTARTDSIFGHGRTLEAALNDFQDQQEDAKGDQ